MKTAISLPDHLFKRADRLAKRQSVSRSEVIARALNAYLQLHDREHLVSELNRIADDQDDQDLKTFIRQTSRHSLSRSEWKP